MAMTITKEYSRHCKRAEDVPEGHWHHFKKEPSHRIAIMDNGNNNNNKSPDEKATQAYKLFSKGTKLPDVAIELGLREKEATKIFSEFLRLRGQQELYEIYLYWLTKLRIVS